MIMKTAQNTISGAAGYAAPEMTVAHVVAEAGFAASEGVEEYLFGIPDYEEGITF